MGIDICTDIGTGVGMYCGTGIGIYCGTGVGMYCGIGGIGGKHGG